MLLRSKRLLLAGALPLAMVGATTTHAAILPAPGGVPQPGTDISTPGLSPAPLGDVNGDGIRDYLGQRDFPITTIVLGSRSLAPVRREDSARVWRIDNTGLDGNTTVPANIGDVDGDGRDDLFLTGDEAAPPFAVGGTIVLGRHAAAGVTTTAIAAGGPRVSGIVYAPQPVGDFDGDGTNDVLVATEFGATILRGGATLQGTIDAANPGAAGIRITATPPAAAVGGIAPVEFARTTSVRALGDTNGDGLGDVAVIRRDPSTRLTYAFVIPGQRGSGNVDLASRAGRAFRVGPVDGAGELVRMGDVNGDRLADLLVPQNTNASRVIRGRAAWADFAISTTFQLISQPGGTGGIRASGALPADVNGDRIDDITLNGAVVWGRPDGTAVTLPRLGVASPYGIVLPGGAVSIGDVNGDGAGDLATDRQSFAGAGIVLGFGGGAAPTPDTTAPQLTITSATNGTFGSCGFLRRYLTPPRLFLSVTETVQLELSVVQGGVVRRGTLSVPGGAQVVPNLPASTVVAAVGPVQVTATPVDPSGNRGAPVSVSTSMNSGTYRISC
jgi:hypothetical protein